MSVILFVCARIIAIIMIIGIIMTIAINRDYCQKCEVLTSIVEKIFVINLQLSGNYRNNLALIVIVWELI